MSNRTTERTQPVPDLTFVLSPADITKDYFVALAADVSTTTGYPGVALLSQAFVLSEARDVIITAGFGISRALTPAIVHIRIDGATVIRGVLPVASSPEPGLFQWKASLAAGAHTVELMWAANDGVNLIYCRPVTEFESATLLIRALGNVEAF